MLSAADSTSSLLLIAERATKARRKQARRHWEEERLCPAVGLGWVDCGVRSGATSEETIRLVYGESRKGVHLVTSTRLHALHTPSPLSVAVGDSSGIFKTLKRGGDLNLRGGYREAFMIERSRSGR